MCVLVGATVIAMRGRAFTLVDVLVGVSCGCSTDAAPPRVTVRLCYPRLKGELSERSVLSSFFCFFIHGAGSINSMTYGCSPCSDVAAQRGLGREEEVEMFDILFCSFLFIEVLIDLYAGASFSFFRFFSFSNRC